MPKRSNFRDELLQAGQVICTAGLSRSCHNDKKKIAYLSAILLSNHGPVVTAKDLQSESNNAIEFEEACPLPIVLKVMKSRALTHQKNTTSFKN